MALKHISHPLKRQNGGNFLTIQANEGLLTINDLARRLQITPDTARELYRRKVIPGIKLGHRTLRFEYVAVIQALRNLEQQQEEQFTARTMK